MKQSAAESLLKLLRAMDHHTLPSTVDAFFSQLPTTTVYELEALARGTAPAAVVAVEPLATGFRWRERAEGSKWHLVLSREPDERERAELVIEMVSVVPRKGG